MSKQKAIFIVIAAVLIIGGAYLFFGGIRSSNPDISKSESRGAVLGENPVDKGNLTEEYMSPDYEFSFRYPKDFSATELEDDAGATVLLQKSDAREGFQIYISEFDEAGPITPERIKKDLPDMVVNSPQHVLIGENKDIPALIFLSKHESLGDVREVWFTTNGALFQLTAYADMDNFIGPILETLTFE